LSAALALAFGVWLTAAPNPARAQDTGETPSIQRDWHIRAGLFIFSSDRSRDRAGEVGFSGIVERSVYRNERYELNVGIGYHGWDTVYSIPITITGIGRYQNLRYGLGIGYTFGKRADGRGSSGVYLAPLVGYQLAHGKHPISVDLRYQFISGSASELDGWSITAGYGF
jgi:hypothetical protein